MAEKTSTDKIDLSALRADPGATETKVVRGIPFEFRTRLPAKVIRDLDMNPETNPNWEFDLQQVVVKSPLLSQEDVDEMDARAYAEVIVECLDIAGLNARPTFR
ncbi:MAG: hypothetical protein ACXQS5_05415 [Candidatus Methanospirareceae archaeon]